MKKDNVKPVIGTCKKCGKEFYKKHNKEAYCSNTCREQARRIQNRRKANKYYYKKNYDLSETENCKKYDTDKYLLYDYRDNHYINFGYHTKDDAKKLCKVLTENDYNIDNLNSECKNLIEMGKHNHITPSKYYTVKDGKYQVSKKIKGESLYFGLFDTVEDAELVVNVLKKNSWNVTADMCDIYGKINVDVIRKNYGSV